MASKKSSLTRFSNPRTMNRTEVSTTLHEVKSEEQTSWILQLWKGVLTRYANTREPQQTPEFFDFVRRFSSSSDFPRIFCEFRGSEAKSLIALRQIPFHIVFHVGQRNLTFPWSTYKACVLLGSKPVALVDGEGSDLPDILIRTISQLPDCDMLTLPAITEPIWETLTAARDRFSSAGLYLHILNGWRECHLIALPDTFQAYEKQFSKKKRYNVNRQIRLLKEHYAGDLQLRKISAPDDVGEILSAVKEIQTEKRKEHMQDIQKYAHLASSGILLAYVLLCQGKAKGIAIGLKTSSTYKLTTLLINEPDAQFSPGSSLMHLMIQDLIENEKISEIDMGYGAPRQKTTSQNIVEKRGYLLISRNSLAIRFDLFLHTVSNAVLNWIKSLREGKTDNAKEDVQ